MTDKKNRNGPSDSVQIAFDKREDRKLKFTTTRHHKKEIEEEAEELGLSMSAAIRHWIQIGRNIEPALDPRNSDESTSSDKNTATKELTPFRELIPEGQENSIDLRDELPSLIDDELIDMVEKDDLITRDGWEVFR